MLHDRAGDIPTYRPTPPNLTTRARRRIAVVMGSAALGIALAAAGAFAGVKSLTGAQPTVPGNPKPPAVGTLAFIGRDGLVVATSDGSWSEVVRPGEYFQFPAYEWSPDGTRIAFVSGFPGGSQTGSAMDVAVMNADGSDVDRLADCSGTPDGKERGRCDGLSWSPDGTRMVFSGEGSLFVVELATGSVRQITGCETCEFDGLPYNPEWSSDGARIAFGSEGGVYVVGTDGSGLIHVAEQSAYDTEWSPDGTRIVFGANDGVYVAEGDGSNLTRLVGQNVRETPNAPTWSPDGSRIAYISTPTAGSDAFLVQVWVVDANGIDKALLYEPPCCANGWGAPAWSPDGRSIAFMVSGELPPAVYVIADDGSGLHRLPGFGFGAPVWKPTG